MNIPPIRLKSFLFFTLFLLFGYTSLKAQQKRVPGVPDSLANMSYEELKDIYWDIMDTDIDKAKIYIKAHINKAKHEKDTMGIATGYSRMAYIHSGTSLGLIYSDSIVNYTKNWNHYEYPAHGHFSMGINKYYLGQYKESLTSFIEALKVSHESNKTLIRSIKRGINALKNKTGQYKEALEIDKEILADIQKEKKFKTKFYEEYINALFNLGTSYAYLKKYDDSESYFVKGLEESKNKRDSVNYYSFFSALGEIKYKQKKFSEAIIILSESLSPSLTSYGQANTYIFRGKSYWDTQQTNLALQDFHKADSIVQAIQDFSPEIVEVYTLLNKYYREQHNQEKQVEYIDKLIYADSVLDADALFLSKEIKDKYDIPILLEERENLISSLQKQNTSISQWVYGLSLAFGLSLFFGLYYVRKRKMDKARFETLIEAQEQLKRIQPKIKEAPRAMGISEEVVHQILTDLHTFEHGNDYLQPGITLQSLSKDLGTNSNYLSKVINVYYHKNFSSYLAELRVSHAIDELQKDTRFRRYTIKAIAEEVGFGNAESFTKAFYKKTEIYPSYYIKQLNKTNSEDKL